MCSSQGDLQARIGSRNCSAFRPTRSACSTTRARTPTATAATARPRNAAAVLSQEVGRPVRLQLSREDEHGWDNYGPALLSDVRGAVDANGKLVALDYRAWVARHGVVRDDVAARARLRRRAPGPAASAVPAPRARAARALFGPSVADRHVRRAESPDRQPPRRRRRVSPNRCVARADGSVHVFRAGRNDGRARARGRSSIRTSSASGTSRTSDGSACSRPRPMRRSGRRASRRRNVSSARVVTGRGIGSARTTCRRTRAIASRMRRPWWISR